MAGFSTDGQGGAKVIPHITVILRESELVTNVELRDTNHHLIKI